MPKKAFTPEQIVAKLRQMEVLLSQGKTIALAAKEAGITETQDCRILGYARLHPAFVQIWMVL